MGLDARKIIFVVCKQQKRRPAWTSVQSDQGICYWLIGKYFINLLLLYLVSLAEETDLIVS